MQIQTHEAHSPDTELTRNDVLRLIPQYEVKSFFRRHHINREVIIGIIGLRGDGKSATTASVSLVDYMFEGKKVWSNMEIKCDLLINADMSKKYGLSSGGIAQFRSEPLEKEALLRLDDTYRGGCLAIEEINVQYSNVRRFMTNTNVDFNIVIQQLRKFGTSLIYNVIDEMFIDPQLRTLTDVFIKCEETALTMEGLMSKKQPGIDFKWVIYPMSGLLVGREKSYYVTKKPLPPIYFHFAPLRGIYDDKAFQRKGIYSQKTQAGNILKTTIDVKSDPDNLAQAKEWGWLEERATMIKNAGIDELEASQLWQILGIAEHGMSPHSVGRMLPAYGIRRYRQNKLGQWIFKIEDFDIDNIKGTNKQGLLQPV